MNALRPAVSATGRLAPGLAGDAAARLFLTTRRPPVAPEAAAVLARARRVTPAPVTHPLVAHEWPGGSRTALLVHGWNGHAGQWHAWVEPLRAAGFTVVALDGPGHGGSPGNTSSLGHLARAVREVASWAGGVDVVAGHSLGGAAVLHALAGGLGAERAVLLGTPAQPGRYIQQFLDLLGLGGSARTHAVAGIEQRAGYPLRSFDLPALAGRVTAELCLIHDETDRNVPPGEAVALAGAFPRARRLTTRGLGHHRLLRDGGVVRDAVAFLDGAPATGILPRAA
ncbi:MAG: alpha/beta fold hydrolase [Deltaproteobacteria bacterium]|nr:alpha/beta fold hydrolase [Deltaproteobacteria bacterium]